MGGVQQWAGGWVGSILPVVFACGQTKLDVTLLAGLVVQPSRLHRDLICSLIQEWTCDCPVWVGGAN